MKDFDIDLSWEAFKYLSINVLNEEELDVFYYLIHHFLNKNNYTCISDGLEELFLLSKSEKLLADTQAIKDYIKTIYVKKSLD